MVDDGAYSECHAGLHLPLITDRAMSNALVYAFQDLGNAKSMRSIWQRRDALTADGDTNSTAAPLTQVSSHPLSLPSSASSPRIFLTRCLCADIDGWSTPERFSMSYLYRHSLDSVTEMRWDNGY
jgi:hypothetical protein